jgi:hypothetical protein
MNYSVSIRRFRIQRKRKIYRRGTQSKSLLRNQNQTVSHRKAHCRQDFPSQATGRPATPQADGRSGDARNLTARRPFKSGARPADQRGPSTLACPSSRASSNAHPPAHSPPGRQGGQSASLGNAFITHERYAIVMEALSNRYNPTFVHVPKL